jgi:hypothetical protein
MRTVLELAFPRKLGREEGNGTHRRRELIDVVLSKVCSEHGSVRDLCECAQQTFVVDHYG